MWLGWCTNLSKVVEVDVDKTIVRRLEVRLERKDAAFVGDVLHRKTIQY